MGQPFHDPLKTKLGKPLQQELLNGQTGIEVVGIVFVVVGAKRKCLICDGIFTPTQAANRAMTVCYRSSADSEQSEGTLDPCSPSLPRIGSSSSPGQA
jgi:hypothetical protein